MNSARRHTRPWFPESASEIVEPIATGDSGIGEGSRDALADTKEYIGERRVLSSGLENANENNELNLSVEQKYHLLSDLIQSESRSEIAQRLFERAGFKNLNDAALKLDTDDELFTTANGDNIRLAPEDPGQINSGIISKHLTNRIEGLDKLDKKLSKLPRFVRERLQDAAKSGVITAAVGSLLLLAGAPVSVPVILGGYLGSQGAKAIAGHFARNKAMYSERSVKDKDGKVTGKEASAAVSASRELAGVLSASMEGARGLMRNLDAMKAKSEAASAAPAVETSAGPEVQAVEAAVDASTEPVSYLPSSVELPPETPDIIDAEFTEDAVIDAESKSIYPDFNDPEVVAAINIAFQKVTRGIHQAELKNVGEFQRLNKRAGWWEAGAGIVGGILGGAVGSAVNAKIVAAENLAHNEDLLKNGQGVWMKGGHVVLPSEPGAHLVHEVNGQLYFEIQASDIDKAQIVAEKAQESMGSIYHFISMPNEQVASHLQEAVATASSNYSQQADILMQAMNNQPQEVSQALFDFVQAHAVNGNGLAMLHEVGGGAANLSSEVSFLTSLLKDIPSILAIAGAMGVNDVVKVLRDSAASARNKKNAKKLFAGLSEGNYGAPTTKAEEKKDAEKTSDKAKTEGTPEEKRADDANKPEDAKKEGEPAVDSDEAKKEEEKKPEEKIVSPKWEKDRETLVKGRAVELLRSSEEMHSRIYALREGDGLFESLGGAQGDEKREKELAYFLGLKSSEKFANQAEFIAYIDRAIEQLKDAARSELEKDSKANPPILGEQAARRLAEVEHITTTIAFAVDTAEDKSINSISALRKEISDLQRKSGSIEKGIDELPSVGDARTYAPIQRDGGSSKKKGGNNGV